MIDITEDGDDANNFGERIGPTRSTFDNGVEIIVPCVDRNINNFSTVPADKSAPNKLTTQATIGERTRHSRRPKTRNSKLSDAALGFMEYAQKGVVDNIQIASSDVAAICGLNKYARPGELLFKYVYKGFPNLMKMDAANLDISIISEEQKVEELMAQTSQAKELKSVLKASKDGKKVKSVADVEIFGKQASKAIQTALVKKELPVHEIHELQRAINSSLFTNFGNRKENTALQEYEDRTGYFVSENNAQCYMMSVDTTADDTTADGVMDTADDIQFIPRTNKRAKSFDIIGFIDGIALAPAVEIANPASASSSHETTGSGKPTNEARDSKPQKRPLRNPARYPKYPKKAKSPIKGTSQKPAAKINTLGKYFSIDRSKGKVESETPVPISHSDGVMPHTRTLKGVAVADGTANGASEDAKTSPMSSDALPRNTQNSELPAGNDKCTVHSAGNDDQGDDDDGTASLALSAQNQDGESDDQTQLPADRLTNSQISASVDSFEDALTILPTQIGTLEQPHTLVPTQTLDSQTNPILPHTQPRGSGQPESTVRNGPESIYTIDVTESVCTATARLDVAINAQSCEGEKDGEEVDSVAPATDLLQEPQMDDEIQSVDENKTNSRLRMRSRDASAVGTDAAAQTPIAETAALMAPTECVPEDLLGRKACAAVVGAGGGAGEMRQGCSKINTDRRAGSGQAVKKANTDLSDGEGQMDDGRVSSDTKQKDVHGEQTERDGEPINPSNQEGHSGTCSTLAGTGGVQTHMGDKDGDACTGSDLDLDNLSSSTREEKIDHVSNGLNDQVNQGDEATQPDAKVAVGIDVTDGQGDDILGQDEGNGVCGMQRLVVEIKNRAGGRIFNPPHLHEQVQVLVYLKLTGCTQGDLVQYVDSDRGKGESLMDISRVRLEDFENADVWESVIVPRLSEFCQIVHKVRQDDNLRTRLMMNSTLDNFEARDDLAVDLCPSMEHASSIRRPRSQSKVK